MMGDSPFSAGPDRQPAHALDPRIAIVTFLLLILFTFVVPGTVGLLVLVGYVALVGRIAGLRPLSLIRRLRGLAFFFPFILVLNAVLVDGRPLPGLFAFMSVEGLAAGVYLGLRVTVIYLATAVFLGAMSQEAVARGVAAIIDPFSPRWASRIALYGFLAVGFVPLFADELERIRTAQRFRGGALEGNWRQRLASVRLLLLPLLISAIHRSGQLALAVEIRGIQQTIRNVLVITPPLTRDYVFGGSSVAIFLVATLA